LASYFTTLSASETDSRIGATVRLPFAAKVLLIS
jgi:hypothetical protein